MKRIIPIVMACMLALCMPALAFAANGDGTGGGGGNGSGGGTGGGSDAPLVVESASIENGTQIGSEESITLVFSKNVCEASVRDANRALVTVKDSQGNDVPAVVTLVDDQVEPDKKNNIVVSFDTAPVAGAYTLTAQAGITSKSGDVLAEDYVLEFTIAADQSGAAANASAASASASSTSASASAAATSASASSSSASANSAASQQSGPDVMLFIIIGIVVVALIAGLVVYFKNKK